MSNKLKIAFAGPGDMHQGYNSLVRGEMRRFINASAVLKGSDKYEPIIIGQTNRSYVDHITMVRYLNIDDVIRDNEEFDVLITCDIPENCGLEENWMSSKISRIKAKYKVFAPFFDSDDHFNCTIPVVYPYYYKRVDNKKTFALPIPYGSREELKLHNNFEAKNAVWTTKNAHENPEYLEISLFYALKAMKESGGRLIIIDGVKLINESYPNKEAIMKLLKDHKDHIWWTKDGAWLPYDKMTMVMSKSKFICGIHHPIVGPSQVEIVFHGGIPIIFQNQKELPPYDNTNIPFISFDNYEEDFKSIYDELKNKESYALFLDKCKSTALLYTDENFMKEFDKLIGVLNV